MIKYSKVKKIHFVGIGGSGMSGIAEVLHNMNHTISGSDLSEGDMVKRLKRLGISIALGHRAENIADAETIVYSSAIKKDNPELVEARKRKIPVIPRAEMLAELMRIKYSFAIAGTHGKTSTTSMIATILSRAGLDPTYVVGGKLKIEESGAKLGASDYLVAEADESDGSFLQLFPTLAIITNIEDDHLDHYGNMENLLQAFTQFADKVPFYGSVILNTDCPNNRRILPDINKRVITYSITREAVLTAKNIESSAFSASFDLFVHGENRGRITLGAGGKHNVSNALAAAAACLEIDIDIDTIKDGLANFTLPERRFQVLYSNDIVIIDDYAHHPTEIKATLETLRSGNFKRITAIFQPHRYTRLEKLMDQFTACFSQADKLIIAPIYSANQSEIAGINGQTLCEKIKAAGVKQVEYIDDFTGINEYLRKEMKKGDAIVFLTAGNLTQTAHELARSLIQEASKA